MKTPTFAEIEAFCRVDGWRQVRVSDHTFFEKRLADGRVLQTHTSFAGNKTMSASRFKLILREQLEVSEADFWEALRTGEPVERPSEFPAPDPSVPVWVIRVLQDHDHLTLEEIQALGSEAAERRVREIWSSGSDSG